MTGIEPTAQELRPAAPSSMRPARRRVRRTLSAISWPVGAVVFALIVWQLAVMVFDVAEYVLPAPTEIAAEFTVRTDTLVTNALATLLVVLEGFALAVMIGVPLGILIVLFPKVERTVYPLLVAAESIPKVAIVPLLVVWFGFGHTSKLIVVVLIAFFPIVVDTALGIRSVHPDLINLIQSMGGSRWDVFRRVRFPNALPHIFSGLKLAVTLAVVGAVVGEFVGSTSGLGYMIVQASGAFQTRLVFAGVVLLSAIGISLFFLVSFLERLSIPWHVAHRSTANSPS
jgi:NitT/TauT family transport system permease protein